MFIFGNTMRRTRNSHTASAWGAWSDIIRNMPPSLVSILHRGVPARTGDFLSSEMGHPIVDVAYAIAKTRTDKTAQVKSVKESGTLTRPTSLDILTRFT